MVTSSLYILHLFFPPKPQYFSFGEFDIVYTVHRNQLHKQTNKMLFLYVFILQLLYTLHVSNDYFFHHQKSTSYSIFSSVHTVLSLTVNVRLSSYAL